MGDNRKGKDLQIWELLHQHLTLLGEWETFQPKLGPLLLPRIHSKRTQNYSRASLTLRSNLEKTLTELRPHQQESLVWEILGLDFHLMMEESDQRQRTDSSLTRFHRLSMIFSRAMASILYKYLNLLLYCFTEYLESLHECVRVLLKQFILCVFHGESFIGIWQGILQES